MATIDGKEVPQCVRCTAFKADAKERTVTKPAQAQPDGEERKVEMKSVLCDDCAASTAETEGYGVKPLGRAKDKDEEESTSAARRPRDEDPPGRTSARDKDEEGPTAAGASSTHGKK